MRTISAYPLTNQEVLDWLKAQEQKFLSSLVIGGMDGVIIHYLKGLVEANPITTTDTTTASS